MSDPLSRLRKLQSTALQECYVYFDQNIRPLPKAPDGSINITAPGLEDNDADAFRHACVSGAYTIEYGEHTAELLGLLNEVNPAAAYSNSVNPRAKNMDLWNNSVGRCYGKKAKSRVELYRSIHEALKKGELITDLSDARDYLGKSAIPKNASKPVIAIQQSQSGRNELYYDTKNQEFLTRESFVAKIETGNYSGYTVKLIQGVPTPVSNPDSKKKNNIG